MLKGFTMNNHKVKILSLLLALGFITNCGMQVRRSDPTSGLQQQSKPQVDGNPSTPIEETTYTIGGTATGIPTGKDVILSANGVQHTISANGDFTLPEEYLSGDDYDVQVVTSVIHTCNSTYDCTLDNGTGTIVDHNVTDLLLKCVKRTGCHH